MQVNGQTLRTIWFDEDSGEIRIIDQTSLPHRFQTLCLDSFAAACQAIESMQVRGAPLIGITAAFGLYLALREEGAGADRARTGERLRQSRPSAVTLSWARQRVREQVSVLPANERCSSAPQLARALADEYAAACRATGDRGLE